MASLGDAPTAARRRRHLPRRVAHAGLAVAVAGLLTLALLHVGGYRPLVVHSDSMAPSVGTGDLIITQAVRPAAVAVGDVVSFHDRSRGDRLVTHRVKEIRRDGGEIAFVTRGDANGAVERWSIGTDARIGRLAVPIPVAGYAITWLTRLPIILALLAIVSLLFAKALFGARRAPGAARVVARSLLAALASSATIVTIPLTLAATEGAFSAVTANAGNTFQAAASFCGSQSVTPDADSYVNQQAPTANFGAAGLMEIDSEATRNMRVLVSFALPTPPAGCTVNTAVLELKRWVGIPYRTLHAKRVTAEWFENAVTWSNQPVSTPVNLATASTGGGIGAATISFDVKTLLASMYAGTNYGFLVKDSAEDTPNGAQAIYSREAGAANAPKLIITYS